MLLKNWANYIPKKITMGFNLCVVPTIEKIKEELEQVGLEKFINKYRKCDSLAGSSESIDFLEKKQKEWRKTNLDGGPKVEFPNL